MHTLWSQADEVPEVVVCCLSSRAVVMGFRLQGVYNVGELDSILDEEDRDVVAHDVPVALLGVELRCEAPNVADSVLNRRS